ncbi:MAG: GIY-YIG nuclease family protein [Acidobacteriaceae bacterium]
MKPGWVYILVGRTGTLYTGVTSDLYRRVLEHREKIRSGFAAKYDCNRLVFYEASGDIGRSIDREKQIKGWTRAKKIALIESLNPEWKDLSKGWGEPMEGFENR